MLAWVLIGLGAAAWTLRSLFVDPPLTGVGGHQCTGNSKPWPGRVMVCGCGAEWVTEYLGTVARWHRYYPAWSLLWHCDRATGRRVRNLRADLANQQKV